MKAAVLRELKRPMAVEESGRPIPGEGEVYQSGSVRVCHLICTSPMVTETIRRHHQLPLIVGHEVAGKVVEVGSGVK